jgi:hypothetical protein
MYFTNFKNITVWLLPLTKGETERGGLKPYSIPNYKPPPNLPLGKGEELL